MFKFVLVILVFVEVCCCLDSKIRLETNSDKILVFSYKNTECINCKLIEAAQFIKYSNKTIILNSYYPEYRFYLNNRQTNEFLCQELLSKTFRLNENASYLFMVNISSSVNRTECNMIELESGNDSLYLPLLIFGPCLMLVWLGFFLIKFLYFKFYLKTSNSYVINSDFGSSTYVITEQEIRPKKKRIKSIDVLRGVCLSVMVFVNYGAGGYSVLDHAVWNGLHLADTVFPIFIFLMGVSIPIAMKSQCKSFKENDIKILLFLRKILKRSLLLFFFGLVTSNSSDVYPSNLRVMGVLQRFSLSYLICAILELVYLKLNAYTYVLLNEETISFKSKFKELFYYPIQWLIMMFFVILWLLLTFLLPVDGCITGYLGPGGLHDNATHFNCTGGSAGYIDRIILGQNHLYQDPTCKLVYQTQIAYDPEGILGILTSSFLTYLGVSIGHVIIHYEENKKKLARFALYSIVYFILGFVLCKFSINDGWIPINKNLWSLSFVLVIAALAIFILLMLYLIIDIYDFNSGAPFLYMGRNSITIYICHIVFGNYFPLFNINQDNHYYLLALNLYWVFIWFIVSYLMDLKKIYINF